MKKILTLFQRNDDARRLVRDEVTPGAEWVCAGEGVATEKFDGTSCLIQDGALYKRHVACPHKKPRADFLPAKEPDPFTGYWPGWLPVGDGPEDQWHREAWKSIHDLADELEMGPSAISDGTYELVGPKIQGNPYGLTSSALVKHGLARLPEMDRSYAGILAYLTTHPRIEGIVWWRDIDDPDCEKVKLKRKDYGLPWPPGKEEG